MTAPASPNTLVLSIADRPAEPVFKTSLDLLPYLGYTVAQIGDFTMTENAVVRARIDEATKTEAAAVLATMGLSLSDAFRLLLKRVAAEKALPFEPLVPNAETIAAMKAARLGELTTVGAPSKLIASLNADR